MLRGRRGFAIVSGLAIAGALVGGMLTPAGTSIAQDLPPTTPTISNLPASGTYGGSFTASVSTDGDGSTSVTSSTTDVCTVESDELTVDFVGVGTCTLTAHVAAGTEYLAADGSSNSFTVGQATPTTPTISNLPASGTYGGSFTASVSTDGDGSTSVTSSTTDVCTVESDELTVDFVGVGTCTLTAHVAAGTEYLAADGSSNSFTVGQATPTTPTISNLPASGTYGGSFTASVSTDGDGSTSVTSSTTDVCTVESDELTVDFVGVGTCTLTAHVAAGTEYLAADGSSNSFTVGQATPTTPTISNLPASGTYGGSFTASVSTDGDGSTSVTSSTTDVCTVESDELTVDFVGVGTCTLTAHVAAGTEYLAADGSSNSFTVSPHAGGGGASGGGGGTTTPPVPPTGSTSSASASSTSEFPNASATDGSLSASAIGVGAITVADFGSDPVAAPTFSATGEYFDVAVASSSTYQSITISDCSIGNGTGLRWFDPSADGGAGAWEAVVGAPGPTLIAGPPACLTVTLADTTSPTVAQLTGTVFGFSGSPKKPPTGMPPKKKPPKKTPPKKTPPKKTPPKKTPPKKTPPKKTPPKKTPPKKTPPKKTPPKKTPPKKTPPKKTPPKKTPPKKTPPKKTPLPMVAVTSAQASVQGSEVAVHLVCTHAACSGTARLSGSIAVKTKRDKKTVTYRKTIVLATGTYKLAAGSAATVGLRLTPVGQDAIAGMAPHLLQAMLGVTVKGVRPATSAVLVVPASSSARTLAVGTRFFVPTPASGAVQQEARLKSRGDLKDARLVGQMLATPQAVWFDGATSRGSTQTPQQVQSQARRTVREAVLQRSVPELVTDNIPGRNCSGGGSPDESAYNRWISAFARGIGSSKAVVILEPDSLVNLPTDCLKYHAPLTSKTYPFTDAQRLAEINFAVSALETDPRVSVYLDAGNSAWASVGVIAERLVQAGVQSAQGFVLNISSDQYTTNSTDYGTWVSDCIAYGTFVKPGKFNNCPNQYWNGGPSGTKIAKLLGAWKGVGLNSYGVWSGSTTKADLNISGINTDFAKLLGATVPITHFVIDTSENGRGMNDMETYAAAPYHQPASVISTLVNGEFCNSPASGLGLAPTAITGDPLVDAYLWLKTPGESAGQCDSAGGARAWNYEAYKRPGWPTSVTARSLFDPLWSTVDPPAGFWFAEMALGLARDAAQSPKAPQNK